MTAIARRGASRICALVAILVAGWITALPRYDAGARAELAAPFEFHRRPLHSMEPVQRFREVEPALRHVDAWVSSVGASVALADADGDALPNDVCLVDPRSDTVSVAPAPGTGERYEPFVLTPATSLPAVAPTGCLPGDFNEDGHLDFLAYYWGRTPSFFLRLPGIALGASAFVSVDLEDPERRWYTDAVTSADVDGDGHVDLVVGNYFPDGARVLDPEAEHDPALEMQDSMSRALNGGQDRIYLWAGAKRGNAPDVRFEEAEGAFPADEARGWTLALGAADLDGDLLPELYVANDFGPDRLYHNRSVPGKVELDRLEGRRTLGIPASKVLGRDSFKGMGVDFGDLDGDGLLDVFVSNITTDFALHESNFAFVNTGHAERMASGAAPFVDESERLGLSRSGWAWDAKFGDFDNDGVSEIVQATGFLKGTVNRWPELHELAMGNDTLLRDPSNWPNFRPGDDLSGHEANAFFVRTPDGRYVDLANEIHVDEPFVTRGIAPADVDGDGRLDFAIANQWEQSYLYENASANAGSFVGIVPLLGDAREGAPPRVLTGRVPVRSRAWPAIGAQVSITLPGGRRVVGQVDRGNGHGGVRSPELLFGLGDHTAPVVRATLAWRSSNGTPRRAVVLLHAGWNTVVLR